MKQFKALIFDLNGTMINDMPYHVKAWHGILNKLGTDISMEQTKQECYGKNSELLERIFPGRFTEEEKNGIGYEKEKKYQEDFRTFLKLVDGLDDFMKRAEKAKMRMAIGSAAIMYNINFVIDGLNIRNYFPVIVSADDVKESKPNPETFLKCAGAMGVAPEDCLVFEDAPKGAETAFNAGMRSVVIQTMHQKDEFNSYPNVLFYIDDFRDKRLEQLINTI